MARDIAEIFYAVNDFSVRVDQLEELLVLDRTQTGLNPYEYIRGRIDVEVKTSCCNGAFERAWQSTENEVAFLNGLYTQLNHLTLLTPKPNLTVHIGLGTATRWPWVYEEWERRFLNTMESLRAPIYDLIHAGVKVIGHTPKNYFRLGKDE